MKIIDKLACPIDYDCAECVNFEIHIGKCYVTKKKQLTYNKSYLSKKNNIFFVPVIQNVHNYFTKPTKYILCSDYQKLNNVKD